MNSGNKYTLENSHTNQLVLVLIKATNYKKKTSKQKLSNLNNLK